MRKLTLTLSVFAVLALCALMANFEPSVVAQRGAPPAPNDLCANAVPVGSVGRFRFDTTGASGLLTDDPCISCCFFGVGQNDKSIWYSMTPPNGSIVVAGYFHNSTCVDASTRVPRSEYPCRAAARRLPSRHHCVIIASLGTYPDDRTVRRGHRIPNAFIILPYAEKAAGNARVVCEQPRRSCCIKAETPDRSNRYGVCT